MQKGRSAEILIFPRYKEARSGSSSELFSHG